MLPRWLVSTPICTFTGRRAHWSKVKQSIIHVSAEFLRLLETPTWSQPMVKRERRVGCYLSWLVAGSANWQRMRREDGFVWWLACRQILLVQFSASCLNFIFPLHTHVSPWLQVVSLLLQHASIITDNRLCCLRCKTLGVGKPVPADGGTHSSPTWLYTVRYIILRHLRYSRILKKGEIVLLRFWAKIAYPRFLAVSLLWFHMTCTVFPSLFSKRILVDLELDCTPKF
jgi:hypothetical protein